MSLGSNWSAFSSGDDFTAQAIKRRFRALERWVNGNIESDDMRGDTRWAASRHVFKPEFYGSPAPRLEGVSGDVHYRSRPFNLESRYYRHEQGGWYKLHKKNDDGTISVLLDPKVDLQDSAIKDPKGLFTPIEGLSVSFHLHKKSLVTLSASWNAWESGGSTGYSSQKNKNKALNDRVALFRLFYKSPEGTSSDLKQAAATDRVLYARSNAGYNFRRQNFSTTWMHEFDPGTHHVYIGVLYFLKDIDGDGYLTLGDGHGHRVKHVYVDARSLVLDATRIYRDRSD